AQRLVGDAVLGVVEEQAGALGGEPLTSPGVLGEQGAQVNVLDLLMVRLERLPGRSADERAHGIVLLFSVASACASGHPATLGPRGPCPRTARCRPRPGSRAASDRGRPDR